MGNPLSFKYMRIQGKEYAKNTMQPRGVFSMCWQLIQDEILSEEDEGLFREIDDWFAENLPWPEPCKRQEPVICWFKTENADEMVKMIRPALWLLEQYNHPYFVVFTDTPGEIVDEDQFQVAAKSDKELVIREVQESWSPED